ncbi:uncharacterized protein LOC101853908 isoform X2 [Aplysia californica]|uniref:Uncharacterized protein LOC101853908 isoform X2 n=1 Tax=Aplysia californica TaxID=6500 RepID=A0ABM0JDT8_APLCA|nr:uncharacterized protein LOC101853908 isoform X2 [Aplysia californica]
MTKQRRSTSCTPYLLLFVLLTTVALAHSQAFERDCRMCWGDLGSIIRALSQESSLSKPTYSAVRNRLSLFRRSENTGSRDKCSICWLSLLQLREKARELEDDSRSYGLNVNRLESFQKEKKAMMNNGWS